MTNDKKNYYIYHKLALFVNKPTCMELKIFAT